MKPQTLNDIFFAVVGRRQERVMLVREASQWAPISSQELYQNVGGMARALKSRCLEMICADFLAGANLDNGDSETLLFSMARFFRFLPDDQKQAFLANLTEKAS